MRQYGVIVSKSGVSQMAAASYAAGIGEAVISRNAHRKLKRRKCETAARKPSWRQRGVISGSSMALALTHPAAAYQYSLQLAKMAALHQ
jgi:hypothetical protein